MYRCNQRFDKVSYDKLCVLIGTHHAEPFSHPDKVALGALHARTEPTGGRPSTRVTKGLTSAAVAEKRVINVGDVLSDPRYLTAPGTTRSEIIIPVLDARAKLL